MLRIRQLPLQGSLCRTTARVVPTVRRRLHRIVRNSLWLFLTHYATPPLPQKSRSARLSVVNALTTAHCRYQLLRIADRGEPCPYGMMLNSILIATVSCYIFADFHGGSKPPPYTIGYIIQFVLTPHL